MTVANLIDAALTSLGELMPGQTSNQEEYAMGLQILNDILDSWSTEHRKIFQIVTIAFPLTPGVGSYTIGPGGVFNSFRPVKIESAGTIRFDANDPDGLRRPLDLISAAAYNGIVEKTAMSKAPLRLYLENGFPLSVIHIWPEPTCG